MNVFEQAKMEPIIQGLDNRYTAFGCYNGRPFVADGETLEEAQENRQDLKDQVIIKFI